MNLIAKIKFHQTDIRMRLKDATLAKLENVHEIKRIKNLLKSRSITRKRRLILERSFRFHTRRVNRYERIKQTLFQDIEYLRNNTRGTESNRLVFRFFLSRFYGVSEI